MERLDQVYVWLINNGIRFFGAIIFLIVGFWLSKFLLKQLGKILKKRNIDPGLITFLRSFSGIALKIVIIISVMGMVGIEMTSFIAVLGAAGLAIGLAFQESLANIAGGVMILLFKPFRVGDFIDAQGSSGTVDEIQIFHTILKTPDNKMIVIPNASISNDTITNFTKQNIRRLEWKFSVAYGTNFKTARDIIENCIKEDTRILAEPEYFIGLSEMADSSVNILVRAWSSTQDFWNVFFDFNEKIYNAFNENEIQIPFPQLDVHLKNQNK